MRKPNYHLFGARNQSENNNDNTQLLAGAATKAAAAKAAETKPKPVENAVTISTQAETKPSAKHSYRGHKHQVTNDRR